MAELRASQGAFRRVAILNRGEAATRFLRALRDYNEERGLQIEGVAFYSEPDRGAPFLNLADEAIPLGPSLVPGPQGGMISVYTSHDFLLEKIEAAGCDAVWPGWGFIAEDAVFVRELERRGIIFIGPSAAAMELLGLKVEAKKLAASVGVPMAPWHEIGAGEGFEETASAAAEIGFPLVVKASAGGGGRGIRMVHERGGLDEALRVVRAEAARSFGESPVFMEACVQAARHIEVQLVVGADGRGAALGIRDCTIQRRYQKVMEEAPSPVVSGVLAETLMASAVRLGEAAGYRGVGTVEFLVDPARDFAHFLEVNTRLQVEHTITEETTGVDLVHAQLDIARGLPWISEARLAAGFEPQGHAIELRLNAEDPERDFQPSPGRVRVFRPPMGPGIRVDSGVSEGAEIAPAFDSMIAKIITWGRDRKQALARMRRALHELEISVEDGATNKSFLAELIRDEAVLKSEADTGWLDRRVGEEAAKPKKGAFEALLVGAILVRERALCDVLERFYADVQGGIPYRFESEKTRVSLSLRGNQANIEAYCVGVDEGGSHWLVGVEPQRPSQAIGTLHQAYLEWSATGAEGAATLHLDDGLATTKYRILASFGRTGLMVEVDGVSHQLELEPGGEVRAPSPSLVVACHVEVGDEVEVGTRLGTLEAMKMEVPLLAPQAGVIRAVSCRPNEQVQAGQVLFEIDEDPGEGEGGAALGGASADVLGSVFAGRGPVVRALTWLFPDSEPSPEAIEPLPKSEARRAVEELSELIVWTFVGMDIPPSFEERLDGLLAAEEGFGNLKGPEIFSPLADILAAFSDIEELFVAELTLPDSPQKMTGQQAFFELCHSLILGRETSPGLVETFRPYWQRALAHLGFDAEASFPTRLTIGRRLSDPGMAWAHALWRLARTQADGARRNTVANALVRTLIALDGAGVRFTERRELELYLAKTAELAPADFPALRDNARQARYLLYKRKRMIERRAEAPLPSLAKESPEELFEFWRFSHFDLESIPAPAPLVAVRARAKANPRDERIIVMAELTQAPIFGLEEEPDSGGAELGYWELEWIFSEALRVIREAQAQRSAGRRYFLNRIILKVRPVLQLTPDALLKVARRLEGATRGHGLQKVVVRAQIMHEGQVVDRVFGFATRGRHRLEFTETPPGTEPIRAASDLSLRFERARRRGAIYPYEMIRSLEGSPEAAVASAPHPDLLHGRFVEYDLDEAGQLVPVERAPGLNTAGVVVGLMSHVTRKYPEGMTRVWIASDSTRAMGALAEPECRRILAAIALAEELQLPIEWLPISSGAKIAMDSGTENLDWTARVLAAIIKFTQAGGEINLVVAAVNVGAQAYWNAEATMLMHTRGALILTGDGSMVLTGKRALEISGGVAAEDERAIGGYRRVMGPNGQAQYYAKNIGDAYRILFDYYNHHYVAPGERAPRSFVTADPPSRNILEYEVALGAGMERVADIFDEEKNPGRKRPYAIRGVLEALVDQDGGWLERFADQHGGETAAVWDAHLGGHAITLIGFESQPVERRDRAPVDGPDKWTGGTLFPQSSKKVARAINQATGRKPVVILANLSGFDGSPESLRKLQLEYGAEIGRAVVNFDGRIVFVVIGRYHGGAYVVFSKALNPNLVAYAVEGTYASVIGGAPAAAVVFPREVRRRADAEPQVVALREALAKETDADQQERLRLALEESLSDAVLRQQGEVAREFDGIHTVERAVRVGSLDDVIAPCEIRSRIIAVLDRDAAAAEET